MSTTLRATAFLTLVLPGTASAQAVLVVDKAGGPGSTHTSLAAAIAAAQDGDFLLVRSGFYQEDVVLDGKGLRIQADAGATPYVNDIRVENLGPGQRAAIGGLITGGLAASPGPSILLRNDQGPVWLQVPSSAWLGVTARIEDCAEVVLESTTVATSFISSVCQGGICYEAAMTIERSTVALFDCFVQGLDGSECSTVWDDGTIGLLAIDSTVWIHGSTIQGGTGAGDCGGATSPGKGGAGLELRGTSVVDLVDNSILGGGGGGSCCGGGGPDGPIFNVVSGKLNKHGNRARRFDTESLVRSGQATSLSYQGKPADLVFLLIAPAPSAFAFLPNVLGPVVVPPTSTVTRLGKADAAGMLTLGLNAPPVLGGARTFYLQVAALNHAAGEVVMGTPTPLHVLAPGY